MFYAEGKIICDENGLRVAECASADDARALVLGVFAAQKLVSTIEITGGVAIVRGFEGEPMLVPIADTEWADLAEAYAIACAAVDAPIKGAPDDIEHAHALVKREVSTHERVDDGVCCWCWTDQPCRAHREAQAPQLVRQLNGWDVYRVGDVFRAISVGRVVERDNLTNLLVFIQNEG